jgi:hypothetical protein
MGMGLRREEAYAGVVQAEDVAVAVFEGGDQALQVGHVVGELRGGGRGSVSCIVDVGGGSGVGCGGMLDGLWERCTLSNTVFISPSVKARIVAVVAVVSWELGVLLAVLAFNAVQCR